MNTRAVRRFWVPCLALILLPLIGCSTLGPRTIPGDRFNYNKSLARSANEQLLLNIVRLRYAEPLHWLEVSSMLSQYSFEARVGANSWWNDLNVWRNPALRAAYGVDGDPSEQDGIDGGITYSDNPTISYAPVQGVDFSRRFLSPIPNSVIFYLIQGGWPIDEVLALCVDRINGLPSTLSTSPSVARSSDPKSEQFEKVLELLRTAQDSGRIQGAIEKSADSDELTLVMDPTEWQSESSLELRGLLGIENDAGRIRLAARGHASSTDELAIQTRSLLGAMQVLARVVEAPESHAKKQMILYWPRSSAARKWLSIKHSSTPKLDAFVQIRHKGYWFYISDSDVQSKHTFALLTYLYSLQATDFAVQVPMLTVPAGR